MPEISRATNQEITQRTISINEFQKMGLLQEVNRQFFHPLGINIGLDVDGDVNNEIIRVTVYDHSDDPRGVWYSEEFIQSQSAKDKAARIDSIKQKFLVARGQMFDGSSVQPIQ